MPAIATTFTGMGALLILHAAYSCMHYRSILMDLDLLDATTSTGSTTSASNDATMMIPPLDVYIELGVAFGLLLLGSLLAMGPLQSVEVVATTASSKHESRKSLAAPAHKTRDFDIYSNRSKILLRRATKTATR